MVDDKDKTPEVVEIPLAKRSKLLLDITSQLQANEPSDIFEVAGHKYFMSTLTSDEEVFADSYCNMTSTVSAYTSIKVPRLSAAIKQIDGIKVEDLFDFPEEMDKANKKFHTSSQYRKRYWVMNQMLLMLGDLPGKFISELWVKYQTLVDRRDASWAELKKVSAGTPSGGGSKDTSLPEKESSQATQT